SSRRRHTISTRDWSSDVCSSDLAVMCAHTLGNPFDLHTVLGFCERHNLWLIEDNCDALGSTYTRQITESESQTRLTGTWGDLSKIGRASCRERGSISVLTGCVKE